jgi:hypothetical protein
VAHLGIGAIYIIVVGPIFGLLKWRFKRGVRYIPAILFAGVAIYISLGSLMINKMTEGLNNGQDEFMSLFTAYICCTVILGQSDFKLTLISIFPMFVAADVALNIARSRRYQKVISELPDEYHGLIAPIHTFQQVKTDLLAGGLLLIALYL